MQNTWTATDWGVEMNGHGLPIELCAMKEEGLYPAILEAAAHFWGPDNDLDFIRAWREAMGRHGIEISRNHYQRTVRAVANMSLHNFLYRAAEITEDPILPHEGHRPYFERKTRKYYDLTDRLAFAIYQSDHQDAYRAGRSMTSPTGFEFRDSPEPEPAAPEADFLEAAE